MPHFLGQSHGHGGRKRHLIAPGLPTRCVFHQKMLEILVEQENKGSSLPWPPACSASRSCQRAWCSSCILERTKHSMSHCQLLCVVTHGFRLLPLIQGTWKSESGSVMGQNKYSNPLHRSPATATLHEPCLRMFSGEECENKFPKCRRQMK